MRTATAVVAAPLVLIAVLLPGGVAFGVLVLCVWALASVEAGRLLARGLLAGAPVAAWVCGFGYVGVGLGSLAALRAFPPVFSTDGPVGPGAGLALLILLTTWAGDTAAYAFGRRLGRRKMAPTISPGKTWEGGAANLVFCVLAGWGLALWFGFPGWTGAGAGAIIGTAGQAGDLLESYVKRRAGAKDSGTLLPGHGGLLDRIDSLLLPAPLLWLFFTLAARFT